MNRKVLENGQALVLVLLSLAVVLTLVLFILSRSITDVAISSREEEALRAFSAAEAGIEKALVIGSSLSDSTIGFSANVTDAAVGLSSFNYPIRLNAGDSSTLWFKAQGAGSDFTGNTLRVCWGDPGYASNLSTTPALELSIFYTTTPNDFSTLKIARVTADPSTAGRTVSNNFSGANSSGCTVDGKSYQFSTQVNFSDLGIPAGVYGTAGGLQMAKAKLIYNSDKSHELAFDVNIAGNAVLPSQGSYIDSLGTAGDANRRISVYQGFPEAPFVFESAVFSSGDITK